MMKQKLTSNYLQQIFYLISLIIGLIGLYNGFSISLKNFNLSSSCPALGVVPACYVVTTGYILMVIATLLKKPSAFIIGFLPVFLLATFGSIMEMQTHDVCPKNANGTPMCYYSLLMVIVLAITFFSWYKISKQIK